MPPTRSVGPKLLVETVEQNTGVRIDNYIEIGFAGFVDVVDAVGGITICPEVAINDPKAGNLKLKKGCQEVDGTHRARATRARAPSPWATSPGPSTSAR